MSCIDVLNSISNAIGPAAIPKEQDNYIYGAIGNHATCAAQGFMFHVGLAVPSYNTMLCLYYLAIIRYDVKEDALNKYEKWMHGFAVIIPLIVAIFGLVFDVFHSRLTFCWIVNKGDNSLAFNVIMYSLLGGFILGFLIIVVSMAMISLHVWKQARTMKKYASIRGSPQNNDLQGRSTTRTTNTDDTSQDTITQAFLYVGCYVITWGLPGYSFFRATNINFVINLLHSICLPLQGMWNCIAFIRPRFIAVRKKYKNQSFWWALRVVIFSSIEEEDAKKRKATYTDRRLQRIRVQTTTMNKTINVNTDFDKGNKDTDDADQVIDLTTSRMDTAQVVNSPENHSTDVDSFRETESELKNDTTEQEDSNANEVFDMNNSIIGNNQKDIIHQPTTPQKLPDLESGLESGYKVPTLAKALENISPIKKLFSPSFSPNRDTTPIPPPQHHVQPPKSLSSLLASDLSMVEAIGTDKRSRRRGSLPLFFQDKKPTVRDPNQSI